ncbi:SUKH-4 family immunity protein [Nocardiopsis mangrovi]|uniref:SUKH-4 family immunity protein n=1 Tax=Nocardiopsis mangrovi TaxID=1179818 RepID=A0ABV9DNG9_9ACTN
MITREQAAAAADAWLNGTAPPERRRAVQMQEFDLGWIVWATSPLPENDLLAGERRPPAEVGGSRGVIDRWSGELTAWPMVGVDEVARMYRERRGGAQRAAAAPAAPPAVGPGNMVVFSYRDASGQESYANGLSGPGTPPPEFQIWGDLRGKGVRPEDVVAVHSDLEAADLPGAYRAKFLRETFPAAQTSHSHRYGADRAQRTRGMAALVEQSDAMRRMSGGAPRPAAAPAPVAFPARPPAPLPDAGLAALLGDAFSDVRRYEPALLARTRLPEATRATLATAGLPGVVPYFFAADTPAGPPAGGLLTDAAAHMRARGTRADEAALAVLAGHVRIGSDGGTAVTVQCIGGENGIGEGCVWSVDITTGIGRYINGSVGGFARCLAAVAGVLPRLRGTDPHAAGAVVAEFQDAVAAIDPSALGDPENWWSVVVEQMWDGLL